MHDKLPIADALRFGWKATKDNFGFLVALCGLILLIWIGAGVFVGLVAYGNESLADALGTILNLIANTVMPTGLIAVTLKFCDGLKARFGDFLCGGKILLFYFLASLLYSIVVAFGILLLIIPGIYMAIRLGQYGYFIVEQKDDPIEALKKSWEATRGMTWNLLLYGLALVALNLAGLAALIAGVFVTILISTIASTYVYRFLNRRRLALPPPQKEPSTLPPVLVE